MSTTRPLRLRFTRLSQTHHRFEAVRADGSREMMELESRSYLPHDLAHLALEHEGGFTTGFYGLLAAGGSYAATAETWTGETGQIERVVARLHGMEQKTPDPSGLCMEIRAGFESSGEAAPAWLTGDLVARALARQRALHGHWRATPFGSAMELTFPLDA